MQLITAS
ncbi:hypothetical protein LINPERPRIM_LOCUS28751 [Linum perenne]